MDSQAKHTPIIQANMMEMKPVNVRTRKQSYPFYKPPSCVVKTSGEIINEARAAMAVSTSFPQGIRTVNTKRPFTPRNTNRILFGSTKNSRRPPSAINIQQVQFHDLDVAALPKIAQLAKPEQRILPEPTLLKLKASRWRLPAITDARLLRKQLHHASSSLENLPEESAEVNYSNKISSSNGSKGTTPMYKDPMMDEQQTNCVTCEPSLETKEQFTSHVEPWTPKDYRTRGFPLGLGSPDKSVVGMDKLMEESEIRDTAIEENRINEARAADVTDICQVKHHRTFEKIVEKPMTQTDSVESVVKKLNLMADTGKQNNTSLIV